MSVVELDAVDVFADVLEAARIRGRVFCRGQFSAPWSIGFAARTIAHFHIIERGGGWLTVEGGTHPIGLASSDVVVVAPGRNYHINDHPQTPPVALTSLVGNDQGGVHTVLKVGGHGSRTDLICGGFEFRSDYARSLWSKLPAVIHVNSR